MGNKGRQDLLRRALRLSRLGLTVSGSYLGQHVLSLLDQEESRDRKLSALHLKNARRVRRELGTLKGPIMKLGQVLSMQSHLLPQDVVTELSGLQLSAPPMHPTLMRTQFHRAIGKYPENVFRKFEVRPFAAASLGQVHRAVLKNGETVAVKIQYPGMKNAIASDFRLLRAVLLPARASRHVEAALLDEIEQGVLDEADYLREADNIDYFGKSLRPLPYVTVPTVIREFTSPKVLTMSLVPGEQLDSFLAMGCSQEIRDRIGGRLFELFYFQVLTLEALHADPHLGNYLFGPAGRIGVVDFGSVKQLSHTIRRSYRKLFFRDPGNPADIDDVFRTLYGRKPPSAGARHAIVDMLKIGNRLFPIPAADGVETVDFGDSAIWNGLASQFQSIISNRLVLPEFVYPLRAELGLYSVLHRLRARVPTSELILNLLGKGGGRTGPALAARRRTS